MIEINIYLYQKFEEQIGIGRLVMLAYTQTLYCFAFRNGRRRRSDVLYRLPPCIDYDDTAIDCLPQHWF